MHVIFVVPNIYEENLGVMYLSSVLKNNGHSTELIAAEYAIIMKRLKLFKGTVILAFHVLAFYADYLVNLNKKIKQNIYNKKIISVFGGIYPTSNPIVIEKFGIDIVCIGEGEYPLLELCTAIDNGDSIHTIKNLWVKNGTRIIKNELRPINSKLDSISFPDRTLFKDKTAFFIDRANVITSRGCTFSCPYCYNDTLKKLYPHIATTYRTRSIHNIIEELLLLKNQFKSKFILFHDDIFTIDNDWFYSLMNEYRTQIHLPFSCNIRIAAINTSLVHALKSAGCHSVSFGLETGNEKARTSLLGKNQETDRIISNSLLLQNNGIKIRTTNIIGIPSTALKDDFDTIKLNIKSKVNFAKVGILSYYPNTAITANTTKIRRWRKYRILKSPLVISYISRIFKNISDRFTRKTLSFSRPPKEYQMPITPYMFKNFHALFPIVVGMPSLLPLLSLLIRLKLHALYVFINFIWDNFACYFIIYPIDLFSQMRTFARCITKTK